MLAETGVGKANGDTRSSLVIPPPRWSLGKTLGGEGSKDEYLVAAVSTELRASEASSSP